MFKTEGVPSPLLYCIQHNIMLVLVSEGNYMAEFTIQSQAAVFTNKFINNPLLGIYVHTYIHGLDSIEKFCTFSFQKYRSRPPNLPVFFYCYIFYLIYSQSFCQKYVKKAIANKIKFFFCFSFCWKVSHFIYLFYFYLFMVNSIQQEQVLFQSIGQVIVVQFLI